MKRYFIMRQDKALAGSVRLRNFNICGKGHLFHKSDADRLNHTTVLYLSPEGGEAAWDFIQSPVCMASVMLRHVLEMYEDGLVFKKVSMIHKEQGRELVYYQVLMDEIRALSDRVERYPDQTEKRILLDPHKTGEHKVFRLADSRMKDPLVHVDVVESILRRSPTGILFQEVEVDHGR